MPPLSFLFYKVEFLFYKIVGPRERRVGLVRAPEVIETQGPTGQVDNALKAPLVRGLGDMVTPCVGG